MKMADAGTSNRHSFSLFWTAKNRVTKENEHFSARKISFSDLKEYLGQYFLLEWFYRDSSFKRHCPLNSFVLSLRRYLYNNKIQKLETGTFSSLTELTKYPIYYDTGHRQLKDEERFVSDKLDLSVTMYIYKRVDLQNCFQSAQ